jgi:gliding motility-associated transport system permease protein
VKAIAATFLRELRAYFFSPLAYVVLFFFLVVNGAIFVLIVSYLNNPAAPAGRPLDVFFGGSFLFWMVLLVSAPVLTMRLIAEERRSGSVESLMTAPVSAGEVVAGKYLAALAFYVFLWLPTLVYAGLIDHYSEIDWGTVGAGYLGIFLVGALFLAIGTFGSSLSRNQIVAAIIGFALIALTFFLAFLPGLVNDPAWKEVFSYVSVVEHMDDFAKGIVDTRRVAFYVTTTLLFLFLTSRMLEEKKWR